MATISTKERLSSLETKFELLTQEVNRQRDDIKALDVKIDAKFDKLGSQIQSLTIAAVVGIGAIVIGGGAIIWAAITSLK